jgi:hypothetical protein
MSNRFDDRRPTALEEQAYTEAREHFAEQLKQFPASREAVERLERDMAKIGLAANMATSRPTPTGNIVQANDDAQWHKGVVLLDNTYLCHRPITGGAEYAVVEYFPAHGRHEILNKGGNVVEVLKAFVEDQRQALQIWTNDVTAQVKEFLAEKYPGQDMSRVAESFMHRFARAVSQQRTQSQEQNHSRGIRV